MRFFRLFHLIVLPTIVELSLLYAQTSPDLREIELTPELVASIETRLSNPTLAAQLEVLDQLVAGKGYFVKIEGKSRKSLVLMLDSQGRQLVKLFDLASTDLKDSKPKGLFYFNGVFSKAERTSQGITEVLVTYARLSSGPGHRYSDEALAFVRRNHQLRRHSNEILAKKPEPAPPPQKPQDSVSTPTSPSVQAEKPAPSEQPSGGTKTQEDLTEEPAEPELPKNRPVLKRRNRGEEEVSPAESAPSNESPSTEPSADPAGVQMPDDQDVVIYRRKKKASGETSERSAPPASNAGIRPRVAAKPRTEVDGMVLIPEGVVTLGSDDPKDQERPLHRVEVAAFYLDKYEVTNAQYKKFCDATGHKVPASWKDSGYPKGMENHPVVEVSWHDASAYARWGGKRLPTEAEWERAAKGPNSYRYAYGNAYDAVKANTQTGQISSVGSYLPNEFGLCDMTGNVNEWTTTLFRPYPYRNTDGREDPQADGARVLRGGSHSSGQENSRCLLRLGGNPSGGSRSDGFRCARDGL